MITFITVGFPSCTKIWHFSAYVSTHHKILDSPISNATMENNLATHPLEISSSPLAPSYFSLVTTHRYKIIKPSTSSELPITSSKLCFSKYVYLLSFGLKHFLHQHTSLITSHKNLKFHHHMVTFGFLDVDVILTFPSQFPTNLLLGLQSASFLDTPQTTKDIVASICLLIVWLYHDIFFWWIMFSTCGSIHTRLYFIKVLGGGWLLHPALCLGSNAHTKGPSWWNRCATCSKHVSIL